MKGKKLFVSFIALLLVLVGCSKEDVSDGHVEFRDATWGMSPSEVKELETDVELISEDDTHIMYKGEYEGLDAVLVYSFDNEELVSGTSTIIGDNYGGEFEYSEKSLDACLDDYMKVHESLTNQYGEPAASSAKEDLSTEDGRKDFLKEAIEEEDFMLSEHWVGDGEDNQGHVYTILSADEVGGASFGVFYTQTVRQAEIDLIDDIDKK